MTFRSLQVCRDLRKITEELRVKGSGSENWEEITFGGEMSDLSIYLFFPWVVPVPVPLRLLVS